MNQVNPDSTQLIKQQSPRCISIAPMLDWTDRHFRFFLRQISQRTYLYSEMLTTGALLFGNTEQHLRFNAAEHPLALQLGGSEPEDLARCATLAEKYGYDEVNLNAGCPSARVQRGAFGACLMYEAELIYRCLSKMREACSLKISLKQRIGVDEICDYDFLRNFVDKTSASGVNIFIIHARNAWLQGLSPKENREIPPLKYDYVYRLKNERPELEIIINGGICTLEQIQKHLLHVDGVMIGREAYHNPYLLADADALFYGSSSAKISRHAVVDAMLPYIEHELSSNSGTNLRHIARHMLGLYHGCAGAKIWRRILSDASLLKNAGPELILSARNEMDNC